MYLYAVLYFIEFLSPKTRRYRAAEQGGGGGRSLDFPHFRASKWHLSKTWFEVSGPAENAQQLASYFFF